MGFQSLNKQFCQVFGVTHFSVLCHSLRHRDTETLKYSLFSSDFFNFRHPQLGGIYFNTYKSRHFLSPHKNVQLQNYSVYFYHLYDVYC